MSKNQNCSGTREIFGLAGWLAVALLGGCSQARDADPATATQPVSSDTVSCPGGYLAGDLFGALAGSIDVGEDRLECSGMPRPDERGIRMRLAVDIEAGQRRLALILSLPDFDPDDLQAEYGSNVTLIEEGSGRFFGTSGLDNCISSGIEIVPLATSAERTAVAGVLNCVSPLAEINGDSSVSLPELRFRGLVDWGET